MTIQNRLLKYISTILSMVILLTVGVRCSGDVTRGLDGFSGEDGQWIHSVLQAEDTRPMDATGLKPLYEGLSHHNHDIQRIAIRGLGRLEQPALGSALIPFLAENKPDVLRIEAANALAQSAYRGNVTIAYPALMQAMESVIDDGVQGTIAQSLGRLPVHGADTLSLIEQALLAASDTDSPIALMGIAQGFESFSRRHRDHQWTDQSLEKLEALAAYKSTEEVINDKTDVRIRRLSMATLVSSGRITPPIIRSALDDPDMKCGV